MPALAAFASSVPAVAGHGYVVKLPDDTYARVFLVAVAPGGSAIKESNTSTRSCPSAGAAEVAAAAGECTSHASGNVLKPRGAAPSMPSAPPEKEPLMFTPKKLGLMTALASVVTLLSTSALAQSFGAAAAKAGANEFDAKTGAMVGAGFAIGLGVLGGTLGQGRAAAADIEGISRNPGASARIQTPMILGLALIESLVLLAFVIAFFLQGK